jgi:hypothetical protein
MLRCFFWSSVYSQTVNKRAALQMLQGGPYCLHNHKEINMDLYRVSLGVVRVATDTKQRVTMLVRERDPLSAAIKAEQEADATLEEPGIMYTHAVSVVPVICVAKAAARPLAIAA